MPRLSDQVSTKVFEPRETGCLSLSLGRPIVRKYRKCSKAVVLAGNENRQPDAPCRTSTVRVDFRRPLSSSGHPSVICLSFSPLGATREPRCRRETGCRGSPQLGVLTKKTRHDRRDRRSRLACSGCLAGQCSLGPGRQTWGGKHGEEAMITRWEVENFKSVQEKADLEIGPLTVFAGANSSGKSSFIQSILLAAQTMTQKKISSHSVVLNGSLIRLGQFSDIISDSGESREIRMKCTCKPLKDQIEFDESRSSPIKFLDFEEICFDVSFTSPVSNSKEDSDHLRPQLVSSGISCKYRDTQESDYQDAYIFIENPTVAADKSRGEFTRGYPDVFDCYFDIDENSKASIDRKYYSITFNNRCVMSHFIPENLIYVIDIPKNRAGDIISLILSSFHQIKSSGKSDIDLSLCSAEVKEALNVVLDGIVDVEKILKDGKSIEFSSDISPEMRDRVADKILGVNIIELFNIVHAKVLELSNYTSVLEPHEMLLLPSTISCARRYLDEAFSSFFRYLGPLRDAPKPLYPLYPSSEPYDIGLKGEHTYFVLELHKKDEVTYIPSSVFENDDVKAEMVTSTLEDALSDWLKYLEVAESLESATLGKQGQVVKAVTKNSKKEHELNHVGVGVSQALPILVAGLISDPDSTLVFEQPELHLHPRVQSRLADFFLSMTLSKRQCLIETHSEHLINRLRYRIAAASSSTKLEEDVKVYFVEKGENGSSFTSVKINEYGAISNWPKGFFDQSQEDIQNILKAASRKGKQRREKSPQAGGVEEEARQDDQVDRSDD